MDLSDPTKTKPLGDCCILFPNTQTNEHVYCISNHNMCIQDIPRKHTYIHIYIYIYYIYYIYYICFDVDDDFSHDKSIKSGVFSPESLPIWRFCLRKSRLHRMKSQKQGGIGKLVPKTDSISICELYIYMYKVYIVIIYVMYPAQACCNAFCTRPPLC